MEKSILKGRSVIARSEATKQSQYNPTARQGSQEAGWRSKSTLSLTLIALLAFAFTALLPGRASAMSNYLGDLTGDLTATGELYQDTCGNCHANWDGGGARGDFTYLWKAYDYAPSGGSTGLHVSLVPLDVFSEGVTIAQKMAASDAAQNIPSPLFGYADKDGDGYVQLFARQKTSGFPMPVVIDLPADAPTVAPIGWDVDDNDSDQGNAAWGVDTTMPSTSDGTIPAQTTNLRGGSLAAAQLPLTWTASGDDGTTGTAYNYDVRFTTQTKLDDYNTLASSSHDIRNPAHWTTMWEIPDCEVKATAEPVLTKSGVVTGPACSSAQLVNQGEQAPLMRGLLSPPPSSPGSTETYAIKALGSEYTTAPNVILDNTTYWAALRTSDGVLEVTGAAGSIFTTTNVNTLTGFSENLSDVSNIVAITAGAGGSAIQTFSPNTADNGDPDVTISIIGLGLASIDSARLYDGGTIITCGTFTNQGATTLDMVCNTNLATGGTYDLDLFNGGTLKAAWVDAVTVTSGGGGDTTDVVDLGGAVPSDSYANADAVTRHVSSFSISTTTTDTVSAIAVTRAGTGVDGDVTMAIYLDGGDNNYGGDDTQVCIGETFSSFIATCSGLSEGQTSAAKNYYIALTTSTPGNGTHTAAVSGITATNSGGNLDNPDATLTVDLSDPTTTAAVSGYTFGNWTGGSGNDQLTVDLTESDAGPSGVLGGSTEYCFGTSAGCSSFTTGTSFSVPASTCPADSTCENYINYRSTDNAGNVQAATQDEFIRIDMQGPTPAGDFAAVSASGTQCDVTYTARTGGDDSPGIGALDAAPYKVTRATSPTTLLADCSDGTIVRDWSALSSTINDTGVSSPDTYNYRVCYKDSLGNISNEATSCTPTSGPATNVGDNGVAKPAGTLYTNAGSTTTHVSSFDISTSTGTDTVSSISVTRAGTGADGDVTMAIYLDGGGGTYGVDDTQVCIGETFSSFIATCSGLTETQSTGAKNYFIALTTSGGPGNGTHTAEVSAIVATNSGAEGDGTDATLTVDTNAPNSNIRGDTGSYTFGNWAGGPGNTQVSVDMDTAADVGPAGIAATYPKYCTGTSCSPSTTYASAFNVPVVACTDGNTCTEDVGYRTDDNATNSDTGSVTVNIDMKGPTPAGDFAAVSASATQCDVTFTARTGGDDSPGIGALDALPYKVVRALDPASPLADCSDSTIVLNWSTDSSTINDGGVANPNTYNYRVCYKDSLGNISNEITSCSPSAASMTQATNDPAATSDKQDAGGGTNLAVGTFRLKVTSGADDTVTSITVSSAGTLADSNVSAVRIWKDVDEDREYSPGTDTQVGSDQTFSSGTADFTSISETATLAGVDYIITYTISASGDGTLQGSVSAIAAVTNGTNAPDAADGTITVDITGPSSGSVTIDEGANTNNQLINLTITCSDATTTCNDMMIEDDSGFLGGSWEGYATSKSNYDIGAGDGNKEVWIKFRDDLNNESSSYSDNILLDTAEPTGTLSIDEGTYTPDEFVNLTLTCSDGTGSGCFQMLISDDNFVTGSWEAFNTSKAWTLTVAGDGLKTVEVKFNDNATNANSVAASSDTITLDTVDPTSVGTPTGGSESTGTNATATFSNGPMDCTTVNTSSFYMEETITTDPVTATVDLTNCVATGVVDLDPDAPLTGSLGYTVYVTAAITDLAGNPLTADSWTFTTTSAVDAADPTFTGGMAGVDDGGATGDSVTLTWDEATDDLTPSLNMVYYVCELIASGGCNLPGNFTDDYGPVLGSGADCTGGGGTCSYTITGLTEGDIYYYRVRAVDEVSKTTIHATEVTVIPYDRTLSVNMYNMVSVPGDLDGSSTPQNIFYVDDLVGDYMRMLYWNTASTPPRYGPVLSGTALTEGEGYWLLRYLLPGTTMIDIDGSDGDNGAYSAYTAQSTSPVLVPLVDGWNAVANPCLTNVTGSTLTTTAGTFDVKLQSSSVITFQVAVGTQVKNTVYHWTGTNYGEYEQVSTASGALRPWKGYWLFVYPGVGDPAVELQIYCDSQ